MGKLIDAIRSFFGDGKSIENLSRVDPFSYPRSSRRTKMLVHEAVRNCVRVNEAPGERKQAETLVFICFECERTIAHIDVRKILRVGQGPPADLVTGIMMAAQEEKFSCHLCGGQTYGLGH